MGIWGFAAVGIGASIGAWLRWWLGVRFNAIVPPMPLGTLAANLLGGFLIGVAIALFDRHASVPPEVRLLVITGFLGGLTTFSTFSAEVTTLLGRAEFGWAAGVMMSHLAGSLFLTALGILTVRALSAS